ncbi:hypothetical protein PHYBOEH_004407 [Phytophthora boehmeriae]|uniref:Uncharacterized protein n=1 Tax=Phytophthora boehmeriae TaxID=109152 RepID=A0A8T1WNI7_9STRA|nr:hypothetical protein PHYBOEH_004407 [Phytophthora boehmeriae]
MDQTQRYEPAADIGLPPSHKRSFSELEVKQLDESLGTMDSLEPYAPALSPDAPDAAELLVEPDCMLLDEEIWKAAPVSASGNHAATSPKPPPHKHARRASKKQVHELQAMVDEMQVQVNGAAAEIHQLALLVSQFVVKRKQEKEQQMRHKTEQQKQDAEEQLFRQREMNTDISTQQQILQAQIKMEHEQFLREQRRCQIQMQKHQRLESLPPALKQGSYLC